MSVRLQLRDAVIAALNADRPTGVPEATKRRFIPGQRLTDRRLAVFLESEDAERPQSRSFPLTDRGLVVVVQAAAAVEEPAEADDALDDLLEHVVESLGNTNLGGLATNVQELSSSWGAGQADLFYIACATRWRVQYQTKRDDLSAKQ
jgi:hypothetical protein